MFEQLLRDKLQEMSSAYERLLQLGREKKVVLIKGNVNQLNTIMQEENKLVKRVQVLEEERIDLVRKLYQAKGIIMEETTLSKVIEIVSSQEEKDKLRLLQEKLFKLLSELKKVNDLNQQLIEQSLEYIQHSITSYTQGQGQNNTYGRSLTEDNQIERTSFFDTKA